MRSTTTSWVAAAACALPFVLAACGSSGSSGSAGPSGVAAATSVAASAAADPDDANGSGDQALFSDAQACAWLTKNLPKVRAAKSDIDAQLALTLGLASFFEKHGGLEKADGFAFDAATVRACKSDHDTAVKKAGINSFGNL